MFHEILDIKLKIYMYFSRANNFYLCTDIHESLNDCRTFIKYVWFLFNKKKL